MDFDDVINKRYSVRGYLDKEVEDEKLEYVLKAATIAPTGVNNQPFKVFVIDTKKNKESLSEIYGAKWFVEAPYVLCVVANVDEAWTRPWDGKNIADIDATIVMDHIILAATNVGLGTCYIFQTFLAIGGVTKFIPSTGVTIPLVSYGGSSLLSTIIMFAIIQGLYLLREDEEEDIERKKKERLRAKRSRQKIEAKRRAPANVKEGAKRSPQRRQAPQTEKARKKQRVR